MSKGSIPPLTLACITFFFVAIFSVQYALYPGFFSGQITSFELVGPQGYAEELTLSEPSLNSLPEPAVMNPYPKPPVTEPLPEPVPKALEPTLRTYLFHGSRNITHYEYWAYSDIYPYIIDVQGNMTLIRYIKHRFSVPDWIVDRVALNKSNTQAMGTCLFDERCIDAGSYRVVVPVSYTLFNVPTVYDSLGPHLDAKIIGFNSGGIQDGYHTTLVRLADGYTITFIDEYQFPLRITRGNTVIFEVSNVQFNRLPAGKLDLLTYSTYNPHLRRFVR